MTRISATFFTRSLLVMALGALTQTALASALVAETRGEAFDLNSKELLYSETHCVSGDALTREVIYRNVEQQLIAFKTLRYETGAETPSFVQHNVLSQDVITVELEQKQEQQEIMITATDGNRPDEPRVVSVKPSAALPVVIDAGFDAFVRENWHSLVAGESKQFQFPVAARESLVELRIASAKCSYETQTDQCFSLELNNWLFNLLADPIELGYDAELQRLARFRGISNISDGEGGALVVDIHYRYHNVVELDCAAVGGDGGDGGDEADEGESKLNSAAINALPLDFTRTSTPIWM